MTLAWSTIWRRLAGRFTYLPCLYSKNEWDKQYAAGRWDFLSGIGELAHHSMIAGYVRGFGAGKSVLDLCCGTGALQNVLDDTSYSTYVGVDISEAAILQAQTCQNPKTSFICADITTFTPTQTFDAIVFNECLYYLPDPLETLSRYRAFLNDRGVFVISMYVERQTRRIWKMVDAAYFVKDAVQITNQAGTSWIVKVLPSN
jgi:2-polyprenyl-3-methyl-5-hydroxy-6-metoxy-1,4-benzoquinol methylase